MLSTRRSKSALHTADRILKCLTGLLSPFRWRTIGLLKMLHMIKAGAPPVGLAPALMHMLKDYPSAMKSALLPVMGAKRPPQWHHALYVACSFVMVAIGGESTSFAVHQEARPQGQPLLGPHSLLSRAVGCNHCRVNQTSAEADLSTYVLMNTSERCRK